MAVLFALLGLVFQSGFVWFLSLLCSGMAITALFRDRRDRDQATQATEHQLARVEKQAEEAVRAWKQRLEEAEQHRATAEKEAQEIHTFLTP